MYSLTGSLSYVLEQVKHGRIVGGVGEASSEPSFTRSVEAVSRLVTNPGRYLLATIRGPPGTGKTTVYLNVFARNNERFQGGDIGIYVAPTNQLVVETLSRYLIAVMGMRSKGGVPRVDDVIEVLSSVRAFGSKVSLGSSVKNEVENIVKSGLVDCGGRSADECVDAIVNALKSIVMGSVTREVKLVFSTEWQDVTRRLRWSLKTSDLIKVGFWVFVDEASRSPFYRAFNPVIGLLEERLRDKSGREDDSRKILGFKGDILGLSVIGDEQQTIAMDSYFHYRKDLLLLLRVKEALERLGLCSRGRVWSGEQCSMLEVTMRLPEPSHEPISYAYYEGRLRASVHARERLSKLQGVADALEREGRSVGGRLGRVFETVANAILSWMPIVVVNVDSFEPGTLAEPKRSYIAAQLARVISREVCAHEDLSDITIAVTGVYGDNVSQALTTYRQYSGGRCLNTRFTTVQSMLGGEADIHITMLGKEWPGEIAEWPGEIAGGKEDTDTTPDDYPDYATIYFREPELFNVQLSRHKRLLIVIGDLERLGVNAKKLFKKLFNKLSTGRAQEIYGLRLVREASASIYEASNLILEHTREPGTFVNLKR